jgi:hypothetical protein
MLKVQNQAKQAMSPGLPLAVVAVSTLKIEYPRIQALSQDKEQGMHPRAATYVVALDYTSL